MLNNKVEAHLRLVYSFGRSLFPITLPPLSPCLTDVLGSGIFVATGSALAPGPARPGLELEVPRAHYPPHPRAPISASTDILTCQFQTPKDVNDALDYETFFAAQGAGRCADQRS